MSRCVIKIKYDTLVAGMYKVKGLKTAENVFILLQSLRRLSLGLVMGIQATQDPWKAHMTLLPTIYQQRNASVDM